TLTLPSAVTLMAPLVLTTVLATTGLKPIWAEAPLAEPPCSVTLSASTVVGPLALPTATPPAVPLMSTLPVAAPKVWPKALGPVTMAAIIAAAGLTDVLTPGEPEKPVVPFQPATRLTAPPLDVLRMLALTVMSPTASNDRSFALA